MVGTRYTLEVQPRIPERLDRLSELANNLFYAWESQIIRLFYRLDADLWEVCEHNPKLFLRRIAQEKLEQAANDRVFMEDYNRALSVYDTYMNETDHSQTQDYVDPDSDLIAYFCAEFGLHESLPIYSGGLGILAGDHCKAASDLNLPFVAVGLLYRQGYFHQTINDKGNQIAHTQTMNFDELPITPVLREDGSQLKTEVTIQNRSVHLNIWQVQAGHINIYLLDSDLPENTPHDRQITHQLYGGDINTRIQQEIVLGIGGVRALRALNISPNIWHINEGHAAFQILERTREYVKELGDFNAAWELTASATVFTTHTPVPAGHDIFDHELVMAHFHHFISELKIDETTFLNLGKHTTNGTFNQTALALRGSRFHNGVSRIHGGIASQMESYVWPEIPVDENPITYVTNGVHVPTFLAKDWARLFDVRVGAGWSAQLLNEEYWQRIDDIPDHVYWSTHQALKLDLFEYVHNKSIIQHRRNGCSDAQIERLTKFLTPEDTDMLVIGFARRFATYKRATLLFSDPERLDRLLNNNRYPVMLIFAGKAHPLDSPGQEFIRTVHQFSKMPEFEGKIILQEGYDMALARKLVAGVDVWLNTPEYPLEASGTSGEKAGINGVINLSVLDGWWGEGFTGTNGWAIKPHGQEFEKNFRDQQEGQDLLNILEKQVIPMYYARNGQQYVNDRRSERTRHSLSEDWVRMSKESMKTIIPKFNSKRMVMDYVKHLYHSAKCKHESLRVDANSQAIVLANWKEKIKSSWHKITIRRADDVIPTKIHAGETIEINVAVRLDGLAPEDVVVECIEGQVDEWDNFKTFTSHRLEPVSSNEQGETIFNLALCPSIPGLQSYLIRLYPFHLSLSHSFEMGFMKWV